MSNTGDEQNTRHLSHTKLVSYDPEWPTMFERKKTLLEGVFKDGAIETAHIGSTSVPVLVSKPIVDVAVLIERKEYRKWGQPPFMI